MSVETPSAIKNTIKFPQAVDQHPLTFIKAKAGVGKVEMFLEVVDKLGNFFVFLLTGSPK